MGDPAGGGRSGELLVKREFFNAEKWVGRVYETPKRLSRLLIANNK